MKWKNYFNNKILRRGYDYYKSDMILSLKYNEDHTVDAKVDGTRIYQVHIDLENESEMTCTCPHYKEGNYCKHLAAVWYAIDNKEEAYNENDFYDYKEDEYDDDDEYYDDYEERVYQQANDIERMVDECDIDVLKDFLKKSLNKHSSLLSEFLSLTSSNSTHTLTIYANELESIFDRYQDDYGYISYEDSFDFESDIHHFINQYVHKLIEDARYEDAFILSRNLFEKVEYLEIDDSNGVIGMITDECINIWKCILNKCKDQRVIQAMFNWIIRQLDTSSYFEDSLHTLFIEYFNEYKEQKLDFIYYKIKSLKDVKDYRRYSLERWLEYGLSLSDHPEQFYEDYWQIPTVRKYAIEKNIENKEYDIAIFRLITSKDIDRDYRGLVREYSQRLLDVYQMINDQEHYIEELWNMILIYDKGNIDIFRKLKKLYTKEEWKVKRNKVFDIAIKSRNVDELYLEENMLKELLEYLSSLNNIDKVQQYEKYLKEQYPKELLKIYYKEVISLASYSGKRSHYQYIVYLLKKMLTYDAGNIVVKQLLNDWKVRYRNRPAMMQELRKIHV